MRLKQHKKQLLKTRQPRLGACLSVQYDKCKHSVRQQTALQTHKLSNKHVHVKYVQCIHVVYIHTYMSYTCMYNGTCTTIHVHAYMYTHTCHIHTRMHVNISYIYTRLHIVHVHVIYVHMSTDTYTFTWEKHVDFCMELGLQRVAVVEARMIT